MRNEAMHGLARVYGTELWEQRQSKVLSSGYDGAVLVLTLDCGCEVSWASGLDMVPDTYGHVCPILCANLGCPNDRTGASAYCKDCGASNT